METISAVITIAELLMFLSGGSGHPNPSLAPFHRPVHLLLHTGPLVSTFKCYSSTVEEPLLLVQLTPCDYWVIGVHEGDCWCEDSSGVHSNKHHWRKKRSPVPERLVGSVTGLLNLTLIALTNGFEKLEEGFSNGQKQIFGDVKTDGARVTHCGALNLTGNTMLLTEYNTTCPAQREKDEHGVERYWPEIDVGSTYKYSSNNECVQAARTCSWSQERGLHLTPSDRFPPCSITNVNLTWAAHNLRNISQKDNISTADIEAAAGVVDRALQLHAMDFLHFDGVSFQHNIDIEKLCEELNNIIGNAVWYDTFNIRNTKWLWIGNNIVA